MQLAIRCSCASLCIGSLELHAHTPQFCLLESRWRPQNTCNPILNGNRKTTKSFRFWQEQHASHQPAISPTLLSSFSEGKLSKSYKDPSNSIGNAEHLLGCMFLLPNQSLMALIKFKKCLSPLRNDCGELQKLKERQRRGRRSAHKWAFVIKSDSSVQGTFIRLVLHRQHSHPTHAGYVCHLAHSQ